MRESRYTHFDQDGRFAITVSSLEAYLTCGELYHRQREAKHRRTTVRQAIGTAVAASAEFDNRRKIERRDPPRLADLVDLGVAAYDREISECEIECNLLEVDKGRDVTADAALTYGRQISPTIADVVLAEEQLGADLGETILLLGKPDCFTASAVRDTKVGRAWRQQDADRSRQLTAYDLLFEARFGTSPHRVAIDSVSRHRDRWTGETIWSRRDERDRAAFVETVRRARVGIERGDARPAPESHWKCSPKWCEFWHTCKVRPGS